MIIDSDYETLTVKDESGKILIRNIDEYNILKYQDFKGNRIIIDLDKDTNITETFDEGIFNISHKGTKMQLRNKIEIAKRVKFCMDNDTIEPIKELLLNNIESEIKDSLLDRWLMPFHERLEVGKKEIIIDKIFKVDMNGQAYNLRSKNNWSHLCIVASQTGQLNRIIKHDLGKVKIDFRTMEIYNKVLFLLFPNLKDTVFTGQLSPQTKRLIKSKVNEY